ncbi:hypothetical protein [Vibrio sp. RE88]|uniref:hypothetical protein n=1 Tax=Vibrio sp. RE88 TaxID=2607610 RepID=UPI001C0F675C|nr:hypothetical protein [Vibrio sp. RE88]
MTAIIKELGYKLKQWKKPIKRQVRKLQAAKAQTIKAKSIAIKQNKPEEYQNRLYNRIIRLEKQAEKLHQVIQERGVHASSNNRFCITFEGKDARQKVDKFMLWAAGARGWPMECRDIEMDDIKSTADTLYFVQHQQFIEKQCYWKSVLLSSIPIREADERERDYWLNVTAEYLGEIQSV